MADIDDSIDDDIMGDSEYSFSSPEVSFSDNSVDNDLRYLPMAGIHVHPIHRRIMNETDHHSFLSSIPQFLMNLLDQQPHYHEFDSDESVIESPQEPVDLTEIDLTNDDSQTNTNSGNASRNIPLSMPLRYDPHSTLYGDIPFNSISNNNISNGPIVELIDESNPTISSLSQNSNQEIHSSTNNDTTIDLTNDNDNDEDEDIIEIKCPIKSKKPVNPKKRLATPQETPVKPPTPDVNVASLIECPICLSPVTKPVTTLCGHIFCKNCIEQAIHYMPFDNRRCPKCKKNIRSKRDIRPIYF
ncbi:hypothetical protein WA158_005236 [Blastocystis sp. Blastoise]